MDSVLSTPMESYHGKPVTTVINKCSWVLMSTASYFSPVVATLRFLGIFQEELQKNFTKFFPGRSRVLPCGWTGETAIQSKMWRFETLHKRLILYLVLYE